MLFYKVVGLMVNDAPATEEDSRAVQRSKERAFARKMLVKSHEYNTNLEQKSKYEETSFCFIASVSEGQVTAGVITPSPDEAEKLAKAYFKYINFPLTEITIDEITFENLRHLLSQGSRNEFIEDDDFVLEKFGLNKLTGRFCRNFDFDEYMVNVQPMPKIIKQAEKYLFTETLQPELNRIATGTPNAKSYGHPVHYLLQTNDKEARINVYQLLIHALYANGRLRSKRYCHTTVTQDEDVYSTSLHALYKMCRGGCVIVQYNAPNDTEEDNYTNSGHNNLEKMCKAAKKFQKDVLTILCLPKACNHVKSQIYEQLGTMAFVEIQEDEVDCARAQHFLRKLAKEHHVRCDQALFRTLEEDKQYLANELHGIFNDWYNHKLRTTVYPQYKDLSHGKQKVKNAPTKGSAYEELQNMIGLTDAKGVMQKALNYYKVRKLYADKGIKYDVPAMHMIFTGNPGTAKTTVARLFAQIMRDNGLLSKGHLVEVGRGDLVDRFVGWTAKKVQAKCREAMGGVLFVDEAYSLVDDRDGSFGDEAINTLVQEMENRRKDLVVILAGYPDKMENFLNKNPGLRSRIAFHVPFADYNADELCEIATLMSKQNGVSLDKEALGKMHTIFETASKQSDFGNGRYVRNLLEQAQMNQASRLLQYDYDEIASDVITTLQAADIEALHMTAKTEKRAIGFVG